MPAATTYYPYTNTTPNPQSGVMNPYGAVPGVISPVTPSTITSLPNPSADLSGVVPGLNDMNSAASGDILGQLSGNLSPATLAALRNASATWGVGSGTGFGNFGLGGLAQNSLFGNVANFAENQVNKGLSNYNQTIPTISSTQTLSPGLQLQAGLANQSAQNQANQFNAGIASQNATNAAAPNPQMAQSYAQQLFQQYMDSMRSPAGGTGAAAGRPGTGTGSGAGTGGAGGTGTQSGTGAPGSMSDIYSWMDPSGQRQTSTEDPFGMFDVVDNPSYGYAPTAPIGNAAASDPGYYNFGGDFGGLKAGFEDFGF